MFLGLNYLLNNHSGSEGVPIFCKIAIHWMLAHIFEFVSEHWLNYVNETWGVFKCWTPCSCRSNLRMESTLLSCEKWVTNARRTQLWDVVYHRSDFDIQMQQGLRGIQRIKESRTKNSKQERYQMKLENLLAVVGMLKSLFKLSSSYSFPVFWKGFEVYLFIPV